MCGKKNRENSGEEYIMEGKEVEKKGLGLTSLEVSIQKIVKVRERCDKRNLYKTEDTLVNRVRIVYDRGEDSMGCKGRGLT